MWLFKTKKGIRTTTGEETTAEHEKKKGPAQPHENDHASSSARPTSAQLARVGKTDEARLQVGQEVALEQLLDRALVRHPLL